MALHLIGCPHVAQHRPYMERTQNAWKEESGKYGKAKNKKCPLRTARNYFEFFIFYSRVFSPSKHTMLRAFRHKAYFERA
jgi:hypothetical protein